MRRTVMLSGRGYALRAIAAAVVAGGSGTTSAFEFDTGNPDLKLRWDNTVRLNGSWRVDKRDDAIARNPALDEGDFKFDKGAMVAKRIDLLSELDLDWRRTFGARVSAAAWYDDAYSDTSVKQNPALAAAGFPSSYDGNQYSSHTKRFYKGPSGEVLDAFVFANLDAREVPVSIRAGRFTTFWGNSVFFQGGIARGQHPLDARKSAASPGTETKELFLPLTQIGAQAQLTPAVSAAVQYYIDWDSTRAPEGGTYLGSADFALDGPERRSLSAADPFRRAAPLEPDSKRGNWGINVKFSPEFFAGQNVGIYYRKYDEKTPWIFSVPGAPAYRAVYARDAELLGVGFDGRLGPVSVGAELAYHKNVGLTSPTFAAVDEGARGNTWHVLINGVYGLTKTPLWDTGTLIAELTYTRLDKVTSNENLFRRVGSALCTNSALSTPTSPVPGDATDGCATEGAWGFGVSFTPQYPQIYPGVDLSVPISYNVGLDGNSPSALGVSEDVATYSIGLRADIKVLHRVELTYADSRAPMRISASGVATGGNGSFGTNDRGRVTLTYKTSF